jgi:uncharacterized membrane protein
MRHWLRWGGRTASVAVIGLGAAHAQPAPADRGFEICNRTTLTVVAAKALNTAEDNKPDDFTTVGWYTLEPGKCQVLWPGKLQYQFYLIYAEARNSNRKWAGKTPLCVDETRDFSLPGQSKACPVDRPRRLFLTVDTGNSPSYTYYIE